MRYLAVILLLSGCKPPPPTPPLPVGPPVCEKRPQLAPEQNCVGIFTVDSRQPCVACGGGVHGCYDRPTGIYCVLTSCLDAIDRGECSEEVPDVLGSRR